MAPPPCNLHSMFALDPGTPSTVQDGPMPLRKLRIGVVARSANLSPDTIRHYERLGLLGVAERSDGGYRLYDAVDLRRVHVIQTALRVGFTLDELAAAFVERRAGHAPCVRVRRLAAEKLVRIDEQIAQLHEIRRALQRALTDWDRRLAATPRGQAAGLLEALGDALPPAPSRAHLRPMPRREARR
jgi:DNA-binding transcriptional MerR regulator